MLTNNGDIELSNSSPMYPFELEQKINNWAGDIITIPSAPESFMPGFVNSFCIKKEKWNDFVEKCLPKMGLKKEYNNNIVWDKDEESYDI